MVALAKMAGVRAVFRTRTVWAFVAALIGCVVMAGAVANGQPAPVGQATSSTPTSAAKGPTDDYQLGAADKIRVIVFGEPSLSGEFVVSGNGKVSLPLIGEVQAAGLTVRAFQDELQNALKAGYLKDPRVSAEVLNFRPYYIMGEISSPGKYPYTDDLTVVNAVATAGGFTYRANKGKVYIKRIGETHEREYRLNPTTRVLPGDTVRIPERLF